MLNAEQPEQTTPIIDPKPADMGDWEVLESLVEGVAVIDLGGTFVRANAALEDVFGVVKGHLAGRELIAFANRDENDLLRDLKASWARGITTSVQLEIRRLDGVLRTLRFTAIPRFDSAGVVLGPLALFQTGNAIQLSKSAPGEQGLQFTEALLNAVPVPVFFKNAEGRYLGCNDLFCRKLGVTREEIMGKRTGDLWPSALAETYHQKDLELLANPRHQEYESKVQSRNGRTLDVIFAKDVFYNAAGNPSGIVGAFSDITELKRAEAALKLSEFSVQQASVATFWIGPDARILRVNRAAGELCGYPEAKLLSLAITELDPNSSPARWPDHWEELRKRQRMSFETEFRHAVGHLIPVEVELNWFEFEKQEYNLTFVRDISTTRQLEAELRQAQKLEAVGTLAGGIAHDFNNILSGIYGFTSLARQAAEGNVELIEYLDEIGRAGQRAAELVRQILSFSRPSDDDQSFVSVQLDCVVLEAVKLLRASSPSTIEFARFVAPDIPPVSGNATQLHQVVMNLGTNAVQAMQDKSGQLTIRVDLVVVDEGSIRSLPNLTLGRWVRLTISDTGDGMDAATKERVFEPFFTTKGPGRGTGLGLSVVHGVIRRHRGVIGLTSEMGRGTTFEVYLPAADNPPSSESAATMPSVRGKGERILFLDDEVIVAKVGAITLAHAGYKVAAETSVLRALELVTRDPQGYDLVVTDLTMPLMTGLEFAKRIHSIRLDLPVILTSGHNSSLTAKVLEDARINEVLLKPYSTADLVMRIQRILSPRG